MTEFPNGIHHYKLFHVSFSEILKYILESVYKFGGEFSTQKHLKKTCNFAGVSEARNVSLS